MHHLGAKRDSFGDLFAKPLPHAGARARGRQTPEACRAYRSHGHHKHRVASFGPCTVPRRLARFCHLASRTANPSLVLPCFGRRALSPTPTPRLVPKSLSRLNDASSSSESLGLQTLARWRRSRAAGRRPSRGVSGGRPFRAARAGGAPAAA